MGSVFSSAARTTPTATHVESRIAYKLQEEAFGGLAPETSSDWRPSVRSTPRSSCAPSRVTSISRRARAAARMGRARAQGTVTAEGLFEYEGSTFKSLTAVARHITGTHWVGPCSSACGKGGAQ
ncbi:MAG: DUF2924 domain-containing protein [Candidatus Accumulibacter necessarius]|uniref:DUF2924 domain-containing protein n=1 Tax=Candidatus Accumulibacter necessarius TaxID=2954386 RepID=UPI002FC34251